MQKSLSADNPGLIVAQIRALELAVPLAVLTCVSKADLQNHAKAQALQKSRVRTGQPQHPAHSPNR